MIDDAELQLAAALQGIPLEQAALMQRARRAQGLMDTPGAQGQSMGRVYRAASPLEHLATALSRYKGGKQLNEIEPQFAGLAQRAQQGALAGARIERGDKDRAFGLQERGLERQTAADAAAQARAAAEAQATAEYRRAQLGQQGQELGLRREQMTQDAWSAVPDQTGGVVMFNKKTGETRPIGPQGPGRPAGAGTGLKPAQFEADVQSFGKDVEPIAKARPDVEALLNATKPEDVSGFGPVAGRVPNMLMTDEGVANRQAAARLMAAIIQATSGQAASEKEVERLLEANGMGRTATTPMLREGISKLDAQYQNLLKQREAKYHPQVVETYRERGGFTSQSAASPEDQQAKAWAEANPNDPRAAQIMERLKAKGL